MAQCKHETPLLVGTADGIVCRRCGRVFQSFDELRASNTPEEVEAPAEAEEKPKKGRKKK